MPHESEPRFEVLAEIAVGNTARVELCRLSGGPRSGELCAVKRLHAHVAVDPRSVDMFRDEVWMTAALKNPYIVELLGSGVDAKGPWFAVELVRGVSLARLMKTVFETGEMFSERLVVFIARSVCDGLAAAHALRSSAGEHLGLVHRDLTPGNVLLGFAGEVKIADFGLAKAKQRATQTLTGLLKGNPQFMSPEQVNSHPLDGRSDIFALGVLLFELFSGRRPWPAANDFEMMRAIAEDRPFDLMVLRPKMDRALARLVERCLEKNPADRYQNAGELVERLDEWLDAHGYREANDGALGRFVRRNAMRQMRWFDRALTDHGHAPLTQRGGAGEADGDFGEDGPTIAHRAINHSPVVGDREGSPRVIIVEATTIRQLAKSEGFDVDGSPTSKHVRAGVPDLPTQPRGLVDEGTTADGLEGSTPFDGDSTVAIDRSSERGSRPPLDSMPGVSSALALAHDIGRLAPDDLGVPPVPSHAPREDRPPTTLQGLGAMAVPYRAFAARPDERADASHWAATAPGLLAPAAVPSVPLPLLTSRPMFDSASGDPHPVNFEHEAQRIRGVAERASGDARRASDVAAACSYAALLASQASALSARGLGAAALERLDEARRFEVGMSSGEIPRPRMLSSDRLVGARGFDSARRTLASRRLLGISVDALIAFVVVALAAALGAFWLFS